MSAYSTTPLARKLGLKAGMTALFYRAPEHYFSLFADWPEGVEVIEWPSERTCVFVHLFVQSFAELETAVARLHPLLAKDGLLWVSWPKGGSGLETDLKRDPIREYLLAQGLGDTKVASVDEQWSGLKFVYRLKDR